VAGAGCGQPNAFSCIVLYGQIILAYADSNRQVVISSSALQRVVQVISTFPQTVTALAWSTQGKLAVAVGDTVYLYGFEGNGTSSATDEDHALPKWRWVGSLQQGSEVMAVAWSPVPEQRLAVCGEEVALWNTEKATKEWSARGRDAVNHCSFSPDGKYLATVAQYQPFVKIWYPCARDELQRRSIYLPHPRSILSICWRPRLSPSRNALLTMGRDGVGRFWMESGKKPSGSPNFSAWAILDSPDTPAVEWLMPPADHQPKKTAESENKEAHAKEHTHTECGRYSRQPLHSADESDFLCGVADTGEFSIWRLHSSRARSASVSLAMRLEMGLGAVGRKVARVWAICGAWGTSGLPTHVDCYVYSRHGGLSFRSFDVAMGADANLLNVTHRDSAGGFAHSAPITRLILSPGTSALLLATLDSVGVCHVWKLSDTTLVHTPS